MEFWGRNGGYVCLVVAVYCLLTQRKLARAYQHATAARDGLIRTLKVELQTNNELIEAQSRYIRALTGRAPEDEQPQRH